MNQNNLDISYNRLLEIWTVVDGNGWITLSSTFGTGSSTIQVTVANDPNFLVGSFPLSSRGAYVTITTLAQSNAMNTCLVQQQIYSNTGYSP